MLKQIQFRRRLLTTLVAITFFFCLVAGKLFYVQIVDGVSLQAKALDQWTRDVPLVARRGGLYDRNGYLLAGTQTSYTMYVRPVEVTDPSSIARLTSEVTGVDYGTLSAKTSRKGVSEVTIAKKLTHEQMATIAASGLRGIYFSRDISRYYPYGDFFSGMMGFTDYDVTGQTGLELYYDDYLKGIDGYQLNNTDIRGKRLDSEVSYIPSVDGCNVVLTIDKSIQYFAESAVQNALLEYRAKQAACIVMDAQTGGISALAQAPSFDLNAVPRDDLNALFAMCKIGAVSDVHEMGSTFKILTMAIALNEGKASLNDTFYCPGSREVDGQRIKCWKTKGHGSQTFAEAVQNSCNCAFMDLALRVGVDTMYRYFDAFGLTSKSGIDVAGETSGLLLKRENVKPVDLARIGFGQAIAVTPIGLVRAVTACINGGLLLVPHVMERVEDYTGKIVKTTYTRSTRVLSESTSATVRQLLLGVVDGGSGRLAGVPGYQIGGKTGTAQKYKDGGIDRGKYLSSFIGFCTMDDPRYVVFLYVDEPQGYLYYGSQVAAPYVGSVFANILQYIGAKPSETSPKSTFVMPDFAGLNYAQVLTQTKALGLYLEASGEGSRVDYQFPAAGAECEEGCVVLVNLS